MPIRLALSLHAPEDALRSRIMPVNERYRIAEVLAACEAWYASAAGAVFVEYLMLGGVNDTLRPGRPARRAARPRAIYKVNLIPYNPTGVGLRGLLAARRSTPSRPCSRSTGFGATVRLTRGRDIDAACGQLAAKAAVGAGRTPTRGPCALAARVAPAARPRPTEEVPMILRHRPARHRAAAAVRPRPRRRQGRPGAHGRALRRDVDAR